MTFTIFITGAADGIGKATARLFAARGWCVGLFDVNREGLEWLAAELGPERCTAFPGDVTRAEDLRAALAAFATAHKDRLDVLFNNAGILVPGEFDEVPWEAHERTVTVNLLGVMKATYEALPYLKRSERACIVNMASASALFGIPDLPAYAATKAAVRSLTEAWSLAFEKHDIRVTDLAPMFVRTRMVTDNLGKFAGVREADVKLTPEGVAARVWKAAHGADLHHYVGADTVLLNFAKRIVPEWAVRRIVKRVIRY